MELNLLLSALPLGVMALLFTEKSTEAELDLSQPLTPEQKRNTFESKPRWQKRALVMLAGPVANFILAIWDLSIIFVILLSVYLFPKYLQYLQSTCKIILLLKQEIP